MCSNESKPLEVIQIIKYNWLKINVMKIKLERQENGTEKRILRAPKPAAGHLQPTPPPETAGPSRASLGQSLVGSLLVSPGSWCA